jgi:signal transduction histidine kinase
VDACIRFHSKSPPLEFGPASANHGRHEPGRHPRSDEPPRGGTGGPTAGREAEDAARDDREKLGNWWLKWGIIAGCWGLVSVGYASHLYVFNALRDTPIAWGEALAESLVDWSAWALLTPAALALGRRVPLWGPRWYRGFPAHVALGLAFSLAQLVLHTLMDQVLLHGITGSREIATAFTHYFARKFHFGVLAYLAIVAVDRAVAFYRDRELRASRLEARLARAQLQALRTQLQPHFLFNTLNSISALMQHDVQAASRMVATLGDLLRASLAADGAQFAPLREELEIVGRYLEIERIRFGDRLAVEVTVDPEALGASVPAFILQPLVENSVRHGVARRRGPGRVEIRAERRDGVLELRVRDDGPGLPGDWQDRAGVGVGLANTRARLDCLYGAGHSLELRSAPAGGVEVTISFPYRTSRECEQGIGHRDTEDTEIAQSLGA